MAAKTSAAGDKRPPKRFQPPRAFAAEAPPPPEPKPARQRERWVRDSFMVETNLGGVIENVPGLDIARVMTGGLLSPSHSGKQSNPGPLPKYGPQPELAFGEGPDWAPVPETSGVPWRCICQIEMRFPGGLIARGTAWFVSADTLITAGHNIFFPKFGGFAEAITVVPGKNGVDVEPYGAYFAREGHVHPEWERSGATALHADIGYLKINDTMVGRRLGWFGLRVFRDEELKGAPLILHCAGYPSNKAAGTQWVDASRLSHFDENFIFYRLDTETGSSGAPIFASFKDGQRQVVACHSHGVADRTSNAGVRITEAIFDQIAEWIG
jgi:glutamyl endopeptidase